MVSIADSFANNLSQISGGFDKNILDQASYINKLQQGGVGGFGDPTQQSPQALASHVTQAIESGDTNNITQALKMLQQLPPEKLKQVLEALPEELKQLLKMLMGAQNPEQQQAQAQQKSGGNCGKSAEGAKAAEGAEGAKAAEPSNEEVNAMDGLRQALDGGESALEQFLAQHPEMAKKLKKKMQESGGPQKLAGKLGGMENVQKLADGLGVDISSQVGKVGESTATK